VADDGGAVHVQSLQRFSHEPGLVLDRVSGVGLFGPPEAPQVQRNHPVSAVEERDHPLPPDERAGEAMEQDDRRGVVRSPFEDLHVAAGQVQDPPTGSGHHG
jgi:hypothetical protein